MPPSSLRRCLAAVLVAAFVLAVPMAQAQVRGATFGGRVFESDGITPRSGVTVQLVRGEGESVYPSPATSADGTFLIDNAPAGSYTLLVDTGEGAFVSPNPLELRPGANKPMALSLGAAGETSGLGSPSQAPMKPWLKWFIIGLLGATGLYVIYEVTDNENAGSNF